MKAKALAIGAALAALSATSAGAVSIDLSKDIQARGAKPDWSLKVSKGTQVTLARPGKPAVQATAPGAAMSPAGVNLAAKTADGRPLTVTLHSRTCTLGGMQHPMTAQVAFGGESLSGCAGPVP